MTADEGRALLEILRWDQEDRLRPLKDKAMGVIDAGGLI
jgi:hypothetical protein